MPATTEDAQAVPPMEVLFVGRDSREAAPTLAGIEAWPLPSSQILPPRAVRKDAEAAAKVFVERFPHQWRLSLLLHLRAMRELGLRCRSTCECCRLLLYR